MKKNSLLFMLLLLQVAVYGRKGDSPGLDNQPLSFLENKGQIRDQEGNLRKDIDFILQTRDMTLYIGKGQMHYQFIKQQAPDTTTYTRANPPKNYQVGGVVNMYRLDVNLVGANKQASFLKEEPQQAQYHYYTGSSRDVVAGVQSYQKIVYKDIYPSIDWVLYTRNNELKYDFVVHPGGKVSDIGMQYSGAQNIRLTTEGGLDIAMPLGALKEAAPYSYETKNKKKISSKFVLKDQTVGFQTGPYNGTLVIDPGVEWATYFGVSGSELGMSVACDNQGYVYISGTTTSLSGIATTGAHQDTFGGGYNDCYLAKFDSLGQLLWATYYGGGGTSSILSGAELSSKVTCDLFGHVYLIGTTLSENNIATPGSFQPVIDPVPVVLNNCNGYLVQFSQEGVRQWGTYYGASAHLTHFLDVTCDKQGNVYVSGQTDSTTSITNQLVTAGAHQAQYGGGSMDALLVKFDSSGNRQWATYYGGQGNEFGQAVVCDDSGHVYLGGVTSMASTNGIASPGAYQTALPSDPMNMGFFAKFDTNGTRLWGSYVNGNVNSLALDPFNHLYIAGTVNVNGPDTAIVTPGSWQYSNQQQSGSPYHGFFMQFNPQNGSRNWGTYYGAEKHTYGQSVTCDDSGNVYLGGYTDSYDPFGTQAIASKGSHQDTLNAAPGLSSPSKDAFLAQFDSTGSRKWATYYGGSADESAGGIVCDPGGAIYMSGTSPSTSAIATPGAYQTTNGGGQDAFLVRFLPVDLALKAVVDPGNDTVCLGDVPLSVWVKNQGRMDKEDTLKIGYSFNGPSMGSLDTFFTGGLVAGASDTFGLGSLDLPFAGSYSVTVYLHYTRDDNERNNDTLHFQLTTTNAQPVADIEVSQVGTVFHFSNTGAQSSDQYHWDFGDGSTSTDANPSNQYAVTDSYLVTLIVTGFCGSDTATVQVAGIGNENGIDPLTLAKALALYPNPAGQNLYLKTTGGLQLLEYDIVNILGQTLLKGDLKQQTTVNVGELSSGSYIIRIRTDKGWINKQFQVVRP